MLDKFLTIFPTISLFSSSTSARMSDTPDNTCCFCLTLQSGTAIIGAANCVFYLSMLTW